MSTIDVIPSTRILQPGLTRSLFGKLFRLLRSRYLARRELRRTRLHLFELSEAALADIGLTREIAEREASRSLLACYLNNSR